MIPITALLAAAAVMAESVERNSSEVQNPGYGDHDKDFYVPRNGTRDGDFDRYYNTTDQSLYLAKLSDKRVVIVSIPKEGHNTATILRISNDPHLRLGVEWGRNMSFVNGDKDDHGRHYEADVTHAVRFIGMLEVNDNINTFSRYAANYFFNNMTWSPFTATNTTSADGTAIITLKTNATSNGLTFNFAIHVSNTPNATLGVSPFSLKYDLDITGTPVYNMKNSHYRMINLVYNSLKDYDNFNATSIGYGVTSYSWVNNVTIDGNPGTITATKLINQTTSTDDTRWFNVVKGSDHESSLDSYSSKVILGFDIPKFMSSFNWDPTVAVDNTKATQEYQASGAEGVKSWAGLAAMAVAMFLL